MRGGREHLSHLDARCGKTDPGAGQRVCEVRQMIIKERGKVYIITGCEGLRRKQLGWWDQE